MTRTRTPRRARSIRSERERTVRREALLVLLARAEHGVLSRTEAAHLRPLVETELADADAARRAVGGQQAAARRAQKRLEAAEEAIREVEADRDALQQLISVSGAAA